MKTLFEQLDEEFIYPKEIKNTVLETIKELIAVDYFLNYFENDHKAVKIVYEKLCESLIPKFLSGQDLFWCEQGFEKIMTDAGVEYSVEILENLNLIYVFDCTVTNDKVLIIRK